MVLVPLLASHRRTQICGAHLDSFFDAAHDKPEAWMDTLCAKDGLKNYLLQDKKAVNLQPYATDEMRKHFVARLKRDGWAAPMCWYRAVVEGHQYESEKDLPAENYTVKVPYLFIAGMKDYVCLPALIEQPKSQGLLPKLTVEKIDTGHWCMFAKPKEVGEMFTRWLRGNY